MTAHPRSRGENEPLTSAPDSSLGSSPLTRGKPAGRPRPRMARGLIPAHAGKTRQALYRFDPTAAHPRSRGENAPDQPTIQSTRGSSPLTRGKRRRHPAGPTRRRLIPAHAGKTHARRTVAPSRRAHPRSRGENAVLVDDLLACRGSSPLTRGKRGTSPTYQPRPRLIPAHAGKTRNEL